MGPEGRCLHCGAGGHVWTIQDWRPLLKLSLMIVLGFSFVRLVVSENSDKQQELAAEYYATGMRAMDAQHPAVAVGALENSLIYSHDNFETQLKLTDALLASGATSEAVDQLHSFLEQRPDDAQVNLKLARLEARRQHVDSALRYYLAAIEGDWPEHTDPFPQRIAVRFESAEYLVEQGRTQEADWALQALAAILPAAWPEQLKLGDMFLRVGDAQRALNVYETELTVDRDNGRDNRLALMGAARASMATGSYASARRYLKELKPPTDESLSLEAELGRIESLDPFAPDLTAKDRAERTITVYRIAARRLEQCGVPGLPAPAAENTATAEQGGQTPEASAPSIPIPSNSTSASPAKAPEHWGELRRWAGQLAPMMNERKLRGRDDLIESTMRFAFQAEMAAAKQCGKAAADDEALLRLAQGRLGAGQ